MCPVRHHPMSYMFRAFENMAPTTDCMALEYFSPCAPLALAAPPRIRGGTHPSFFPQILDAKIFRIQGERLRIQGERVSQGERRKGRAGAELLLLLLRSLALAAPPTLPRPHCSSRAPSPLLLLPSCSSRKSATAALVRLTVLESLVMSQKWSNRPVLRYAQTCAAMR
jgi:hypothetical protein